MLRRPNPLISFEHVPLGACARVHSLEALDETQAGRLAELGLTPGTLFKVVKIAPLGDPVEVEFRGARFCLRRAESQGLLVEVISE